MSAQLIELSEENQVIYYKYTKKLSKISKDLINRENSIQARVNLSLNLENY